MAEMARRLHPPSPVPQGVCAAHREPLAAFCGDELRLLCAACERSGEHWAHRVRPLQDAAEDLKVWAGPGQSAAWQGVAAARGGGPGLVGAHPVRCRGLRFQPAPGLGGV